MLSNKVKVIANAFIRGVSEYNREKPFGEKVTMSHRRLQKLLYLCEIEYMKKHEGTPLFEEEFYAWPSGPAIPGVYTEYWLRSLNSGEVPCKGIPTDEEQNLIDDILCLTAKLDTIDLVNACSVVGGPWCRTFDVNDPEHNQIVSKDDSCIFYSVRDWKADVLKV